MFVTYTDSISNIRNNSITIYCIRCGNHNCVSYSCKNRTDGIIVFGNGNAPTYRSERQKEFDEWFEELGILTEKEKNKKLDQMARDRAQCHSEAEQRRFVIGLINELRQTYVC